MELVKERSEYLENAAEAYQFYSDANEAESWLKEKISIVTSADYGSDEPNSQALFRRHKDLQGALGAYNEDINSLNAQAKKLIASLLKKPNANFQTEKLESLGDLLEENK